MTSALKRRRDWMINSVHDGLIPNKGDGLMPQGEVVNTSILEGNRGGSFTVKSLDATAGDEMARLRSEGIGVRNDGIVFDETTNGIAQEVTAGLLGFSESLGTVSRPGGFRGERGHRRTRREQG